MNKTVNIKTNLMLKDKKIASFVLSLSEDWLSVSDLFVIEKDFLPLQTQKDFYSWFLFRVMLSSTRHYIQTISTVFHYGSKRLPYAQIALSLKTNCVSLSDHYWLNPEEDFVFEHQGILIAFKNKDWNMVNPYNVENWSFDVNDLLIHDSLLMCSDKDYRVENPIWTTNGKKQKRWLFDNNVWLLEKRESKAQIRDEENCFVFFENRGFLTPQYKTIHCDVSDRYMYIPSTIRNGIDIIQKQCLSSKTHYMLPLISFVNEYNDSDLNLIMRDVLDFIKIDSNMLKKFQKAIEEYIKENNYAQIATSNLGFLVDCDNNAVPVVWSNIGIRKEDLIFG